MYTVRKLHIGKTEQLEKLSLASGKLYSQAVVFFWRTVRKKNIWLKPSSIMRYLTSKELHAHTADAVVQSFYSALDSWRQRRQSNPESKPPRRLRKYYKLIYKSSAIRLREGLLILSNGKGNEPLYFHWDWDLPKQIEIGWNGDQYELRAIYVYGKQEQTLGDGVAGVDLGEVHTATVFDGEQTTIFNGRYLRSKRHYQNKIKAKFSQKLDTTKKGTREWKRVKQAKERVLKRLNNQTRDILHKQTTALVSMLYHRGIHTLVIGDVKNIRNSINYGAKVNQKLHQWAFAKTTWMLKYKWERLGGEVVMQNEAYTSQTCPQCGSLNKPNGRQYHCSICGFEYHRDGVGAVNIRQKYRKETSVFGNMALPVGVRFNPHLCRFMESEVYVS